ncbi:SDR family NAD(P)-dependent oxidoreductase [Mucilaginibacter sp. BJC16-A38]|uniref:SDR family NAD(P)-dependent oxidoreductase n=1 Tax=Mucilaginibacter phenanthrenivorans TaxID=1234842 RepID=UPI0021580F8B|nr:SDR family NAD(P)-dependent oxidoreductase [Mucilaginibacter phenanthrenivorans]MCR8557323.1 SDR family NAD(P)-dependent oxidoreductase [Mucilaginibacter phenanthrenivorans]
MNNSKIIFITAASRGFGRIWAEAALENGHKVIATARNVSALDGLKARYGEAVLPLQLDVTNRDEVFAVVAEGSRHFGGLDVVINVAGFSLYGMIEETTEREARTQLETNLFGPLWVTQAALPVMRSQRSGHIIQVSSIGGIITFPSLGMYHTSKWGLEAFSETLAQEVKDFGIKVTLIEPGIFETSKDENPPVQENRIAAYDSVRAELYRQFNIKKGNPHATTGLILRIIEEKAPPLRLFLGDMPYPLVIKQYEERLKTWSAWKDAAEAAG